MRFTPGGYAVGSYGSLRGDLGRSSTLPAARFSGRSSELLKAGAAFERSFNKTSLEFGGKGAPPECIAYILSEPGEVVQNITATKRIS